MKNRLWLLLLPALLASCATPGEIAQRRANFESTNQANIDAQRASYDRDMAEAIDWNHHVLGIPSSGWMVIIVLSIIVGSGMLIALGTSIYYSRERNANARHRLAEQQEQTKRELIKSAKCLVCGGTPTMEEVNAAVKTKSR